MKNAAHGHNEISAKQFHAALQLERDFETCRRKP
jgi:hypothetical protein